MATPPTTGAAKDRRQRRRLLAESMQRGDITFGADTDQAAVESFMEQGLSSRRGAPSDPERKKGVALGTVWPLTREECPRYRELVRQAAEQGVEAVIRINRPPKGSSAVATPFLSLLLRGDYQDTYVPLDPNNIVAELSNRPRPQ